MAVTVTAAATSYDLTVKATVKTELGISGNGDDALIDVLISQASAVIRAACNREFARETVQETLKASGKSLLMMTRTPIISVTSIALDGVTVDSSDYSVDEPGAGLIFSSCGWQETAKKLSGIGQLPVGNSRAYLYTVIYVAGYILPGMSGTRDLPADIERACIDLVKAYYLGRDRDPTIESESVPDVGSVKYNVSEVGIPPHVDMILSRWRRAM